MFRGFIKFFTDGYLLKRYFAILVGLIIFRLLATVPVPGIDSSTVATLLSSNHFLGVFNIFSGGGLSNFSIVMLGVFPYITVSIVGQLLTVVFPQLHSLYHEEGEIGRKKFNQWTRVATVPVALLNSIGILFYFQAQQVIPQLALADFATTVIIVVAGALLLMWVGELITEFGIGNGISLIVFAGIVVSLPVVLQQAVSSYTSELLPIYIGGGVGAFILIAVAVWMNEADRPVPVTYSRYGVGYGAGERRVETYIPIKINPAGVLPIIFSLTVGAFLQFVFRWLSEKGWFISEYTQYAHEFLANGYYYAIVVGLLTLFFTYFHAPIVFNTKKIAENLSKQGAFVPGLRPGEETIKHFDTVLNRILFYAAIFLVFIAIIPYIITGSTAGTFLFSIGGTGILIVVSVVLDIYRKTSARITTLLEQ